MVEDPDTAAELALAAQLGGESATVRRVMGQMLSTEMESLVSQLAHCEPDLGRYAKLAGQLLTIYRIQGTLDIRIAAGTEAQIELMNQKEGA